VEVEVRQRAQNDGTVGTLVSALLASDGLDLKSAPTVRRASSQGSIQDHGYDSRMNEWSKYELAASHIASVLPF
jgi:hypothetical protein